MATSASLDLHAPVEESFQFLNLPPELRIMIYRMLVKSRDWRCYRYGSGTFPSPSNKVLYTNFWVDQSFHPNIIRVNRFLSQEASSILYSEVTFKFNILYSPDGWKFMQEAFYVPKQLQKLVLHFKADSWRYNDSKGVMALNFGHIISGLQNMPCLQELTLIFNYPCLVMFLDRFKAVKDLKRVTLEGVDEEIAGQLKAAMEKPPQKRVSLGKED